MKSRMAVAIAVLTAVTVFAQDSPHVTAPARISPAVAMQGSAVGGVLLRSASSPTSAQVAPAQIKELEDTIAKMHALVKAMKAKETASKNKTVLNDVQLWELLVTRLDQTLAREKRAAAERADFMARRESLYRQAQQNADASAARARAAAAMASSSSSGAGPGTQEQAPPAAQASQEAMPKQ